VQWSMIYLHITKCEFTFKSPAMILFLVFRKVITFKFAHLLKIYQHTWHSPTLPCKFCIHLTSLKVRHFVMVEATRQSYGVEVTFMARPPFWIS
jgi:hypothetical protein